MSTRLPIPAARIDDVASASHVCARTVQKYRAGLHVLDVVELAITAAVRELPPDPQLELPAPKPAKRERTAAVVRSAAKPKPRPRLVLELPDGVDAPEPDGRHWYEEREST